MDYGGYSEGKEKKGFWHGLTLSLLVISIITGITGLSILGLIEKLMEGGSDMVLSVIVLLSYSLLLVGLTWLLADKKIPSRAYWIRRDLKKNRIPKLQDKIKRELIPRLQDKVIERSELSEFENRNDFIEGWLKGSEGRYSTLRILTSSHISESVFDRLDTRVVNEFKQVDDDLYKKLEDLAKGLKEYDIWVTKFLEVVIGCYKDKVLDWQNLAELYVYELFEVNELKRRKGHKADKNKLNACPTSLEYNKVKKLSDELIIKCNLIINGV